MKKITFFCAVIFSFLAHAQEIAGTTDLKESDAKKNTTEIFEFVEKPAVFPTGIDAFRNMIAQKFRGRKVNGNGTQRCIITFVVERDGSIAQIQAAGNNESFNQEAIKSVSKIKEKWIPAELNGYKIRYRYKIPLTMTFE